MRRSGVQLPSAPPAFPHHFGFIDSAPRAILRRPAPRPFFDARAFLAGECHDIDTNGQKRLDLGCRHLAPADGAIGPPVMQQIFRNRLGQRTSAECHDPYSSRGASLYARPEKESARQITCARLSLFRHRPRFVPETDRRHDGKGTAIGFGFNLGRSRVIFLHRATRSGSLRSRKNEREAADGVYIGRLPSNDCRLRTT